MSVFVMASLAFAQGVVTAGLTGTVRDESGQVMAGVTVSALHLPTATTYTTQSTDAGRYNFRGMIVGGPYTLTATSPGKSAIAVTDVTTELGQDATVNVAFEATDVVMMEAFTVSAKIGDLNPAADGAGSVLTRERLLAQPTAQRSFADMARTDAMVTLRNVFGDRQEAMLTAVGQNNRFNSIMLDGARINDQFGLNASGLGSFFNPLSLETVEQFSIATSPYDVRQSGFTGAAINAVTRSGSNTFHGSLYGFHTDEALAGRDLIGPAAGTRPHDERQTWGATLSGPLLKDRLFFFINYEKFNRTQSAAGPTMTPDDADLATITQTLAAIGAASGHAFDPGTFMAPSIRTEEEKRLYKVDWNITNDHRLSVRYNETSGSLPSFGRSNMIGGTFTGMAGAAGPIATRGTALSSNFFTQERREEVWAGTLTSQWTHNLQTEFKYSTTSWEQLTNTPAAFPEVRIFGVSGIGSDGQPVTNAAGAPSGVLVLGTEQFRQGNIVDYNTTSYSGNAGYSWRDFQFTAGFDREESDFFNLFRTGSYGLFDYSSLAAFVADRPAVFGRAMYVEGTPPGDVSSFAITGLFGQAKWNVGPRLNLTAGARFDLLDSDTRPALNPLFVSTFGLRNDGNVDGTQSISPRLGFNWSLDEARTMQVRGGAGYFTGRAPWVFISNAYGNTGVGRFNQVAFGPGAPSLATYLRDTFDPSNPIGVATSDGDPNARREINLLQDGLKLPAVWRGNLAIEQKLPILDSSFTVEAVHTRNDHALFTDNLNIQPLAAGASIGLDGRQRFNGGATSAGATSVAFTNVVRVRNVSAGRSTYVSVGLNRPMINNWSYHLTYTRGRSTEAQSFGQTVAVDNWSRHAVFNQNTIEVQRSDFEVRNRIQFAASRRFEPRPRWWTTVSLYYDGHTGSPFSYVYDGDLNGDGVATNDLVYVPDGDNDPNVDYGGMTATQRADYLAFLQDSGLARYAGTHAPRNAFVQPWINQLDLRVAQKLPIYEPLEVELFVDFINFGYWLSRRAFGTTELLTSTNNAVFYRRVMGAATYNSAGQVRPTHPGEPGDTIVDNIASRWRVQFGATVRF